MLRSTSCSIAWIAPLEVAPAGLGDRLRPRDHPSERESFEAEFDLDDHRKDRPDNHDEGAEDEEGRARRLAAQNDAERVEAESEHDDEESLGVRQGRAEPLAERLRSAASHHEPPGRTPWSRAALWARPNRVS